MHGSKETAEMSVRPVFRYSIRRRPPSMAEELQRRMRVIHDLERAIRLWELLRDDAQRVVDETKAGPEKLGDSVETNPTVAKRAPILTPAMRQFSQPRNESTNWQGGIRNANPLPGLPHLKERQTSGESNAAWRTSSSMHIG
jgi:hypothetical protein